MTLNPHFIYDFDLNPDGKSATLTAGFTYYPPPQIAAISPKSGPRLGGTEVVISGANFIQDQEAEVRFGNSLATEVIVVSQSQLKAKTPFGAPGSVDVNVITTGGTSQPLSPGFSYTPSPLILNISPTRIPKGGGTLSLTGENFATGATATIEGQAATEVNVLSATTMTLIAPAMAQGAKAEADVVITNPNGQSATLTAGVLYVSDPIVSRIEPISGAVAGGAEATFFGANFVSGTSVAFGGSEAQVKTVSESGNKMVIIIPSAPAPKDFSFSNSFSVDVVVKNPDGKSFTLLGGFSYLAKPSVFAISPEIRLSLSAEPLIIFRTYAVDIETAVG